MMTSLSIRNVALIEREDIPFYDGFSVLTGETGAGKSIIIESLNFVLGERASREMIQTGAQKASVEATFSVEKDSAVQKLLQESGLDQEDGTLVLYRELTVSGRNVCRANGVMIGTAELKEIGDLLVDIHGQHAHQSLLNPKNHLELLDEFAGAEAKTLRLKTAAAYDALKKAEKALSVSGMNEQERLRKCDLYEYQLKEIREAALKEDEEEELSAELDKLRNAEKITEALGSATESLNGDKGALSLVSEALRELEEIAPFSKEYEEIAEKLRGYYYEIEDAAYSVRDQRDCFSFDPDTLDRLEWRMDTIDKMKRKYGPTVSDVLTYAAETEKEYDALVHMEEQREALERAREASEKEYRLLAGQLTDVRKAAAERLEKALLPELSELGMSGASFVVNAEPVPEGYASANGSDKIEFLLSANRGEPVKPLSKVASGGELSRIMLAFKSVLSNADAIPTMVFDEIDTGVSGRMGTAIAVKMRGIAKNHQVLCVTHLPQIAAYAHTQYLIEKREENGRTVSSAVRLDTEGRIKEIARIMDGRADDPLSLKHAEEMLEKAQEE